MRLRHGTDFYIKELRLQVIDRASNKVQQQVDKIPVNNHSKVSLTKYHTDRLVYQIFKRIYELVPVIIEDMTVEI